LYKHKAALIEDAIAKPSWIKTCRHYDDLTYM